MDCSVVPLRQKGLFMISTTDFFFPSVDNARQQGRIGCANVLSDLYAMGIVECDSMLMLLAGSTDMEQPLRDQVMREMIEGFTETAQAAETEVTGGQTVLNPWPIIGGVAMAICKKDEFILPENAKEGHVLVLTKPLGTQLAVNAHQWLHKANNRWDQIRDIVSVDQVEQAYTQAVENMTRLNRNAAKLMHKYRASAATDVTGFGILGHANNLARNQRAQVDIQIHTLPIIKYMKEVASRATFFNLLGGTSAETSGGLLVALPAENAAPFIKELESMDNRPAWIVGRVTKRSGADNAAYIMENPTIIDAE